MRRSCESCPEAPMQYVPRTIVAGLLLAAAFLTSGPAAAAQAPDAVGPIEVVVLDRPPYYQVHDGRPSGFLLLRAQRFIEQAKIPIGGYATYPPRRILAMIRKNEGRYCSVGWFRTAERESYARFSAPIHVDRPHIVLAHPDAWFAVSARGALLPLMDDPDLRLGLIDGYSYGTYLDALIAARQGPTNADSADAPQLLKMLAAGRVDFALLDREEADVLMTGNESAKSLRAVFLNGMPEGQRRHLICSLQVSEAEMRAIDAVIAREPRTVRR